MLILDIDVIFVLCSNTKGVWNMLDEVLATIHKSHITDIPKCSFRGMQGPLRANTEIHRLVKQILGLSWVF